MISFHDMKVLKSLFFFSLKAFVRPLKRKTSKETEQGLVSMIEENGKSPYKLWTDRGKNIQINFTPFYFS